MTSIKQTLTAARDHHQRTGGTHTGSLYAEYPRNADTPCCMLGALDYVTAVDGTSHTSSYYNAYHHLIGEIGEHQSIGSFNDHATAEERAAMWQSAIDTAPEETS